MEDYVNKKGQKVKKNKELMVNIVQSSMLYTKLNFKLKVKKMSKF
jgi:hypothetical protein